jgi:hypothetical protein
MDADGALAPGTSIATGDRVRDGLGRAFGDAIGLYVVLRIAFGLIAAYVWWQATAPGPCHFELARNGWSTIPPLADQGPAFPLVGVWQRWDACWYTKIATFGYERGVDSVNFWPLFPLLTGLVGRLLGGAMALGGLVVAGVAYVVAMTGLRRLVAIDFDDDVALTTVVAISIFPTAFFFFAPFTEALFLACAVWAILAARRRIWWLAALAGLLAALTRIQGVFLVLPLAWEAFAAWRETSRGSVGRRSAVAIVSSALAVLAPVIGFTGFLAASSALAGQTPLQTQEAWGGTNFHPPWEVVDASWRWALDHHDPLQLLNLATLLLFGFVAIVGLRQVPLAYSLYALPQIAILATRIQPTPLTSTARYLLVVFPVFVILALVPPRWRWLRFGWAVTSIMLLGLLVADFVRGNYVA